MGPYAQGGTKPLPQEYLLTPRVDTIFSYARTKSKRISGLTSSVA